MHLNDSFIFLGLRCATAQQIELLYMAWAPIIHSLLSVTPSVEHIFSDTAKHMN